MQHFQVGAMRRMLLPALCILASGTVCIAAASAAEKDAAVAAPDRVGPGQGDLLHAADQALGGNRAVEAQALLERLDRNASEADRSAARLLRAELLITAGRPAEAQRLLQLLYRPERESCRGVSAQGLALMQLGDLTSADSHLLPFSRQCADEPVFWHALALLHLASARAGDAVDALERALALRPDDDTIRNDLAVALIAWGDPGHASQILADLVNRSPNQPELLINLDFARGMMGRPPSRRSSDSDEFWSRRLEFAGSGAQRAGRLQLAEALLAEAMIERPRHDTQLWRQYSAVSAKR